MQATPETLRAAWTRRAATVSRKINLAWWLETLSVPLVTIGIIGSAVLLLVRREAPLTPAWQLAAAATAAVLLTAAIAWAVARRRFEKPEQSMVRIEAAMRLRNALSAARAGVAPWPELPPRIDAGIDWHWRRILVPPLAALALLAAGLLIPIAARTSGDTARPDQPLAWENLAADLERLDQEEVIDETYLEEMRKKLEELRAQEEEDWFSHSSLEATDTLKKQHSSAVEKLERELGRADQALGNLERNAGGMPAADKERLLQQFDQALQGLRNGALKPNPQLLDQLQQLDPGQLGKLDPGQLQQLKQNLQKAAQACKECQGGGQQGGGQGDEWLDELLDGDGEGQGQGQGKDDPNGGDPNGEGSGKGGITRGPGHAPGVLGQEGERLATGDLTGLESKDLSRAFPGDLLQLQDGEHDVDKSPVAPRAGGQAGATGDGGDRVWKDALDPDEQKALKKFFE
jgi:alpha-ketoglutarate-dependent taurine dioxygenase